MEVKVALFLGGGYHNDKGAVLDETELARYSLESRGVVAVVRGIEGDIIRVGIRHASTDILLVLAEEVGI